MWFTAGQQYSPGYLLRHWPVGKYQIALASTANITTTSEHEHDSDSDSDGDGDSDSDGDSVMDMDNDMDSDSGHALTVIIALLPDLYSVLAPKPMLM